jgi:hypothetical protein
MENISTIFNMQLFCFNNSCLCFVYIAYNEHILRIVLLHASKQGTVFAFTTV